MRQIIILLCLSLVVTSCNKGAKGGKSWSVGDGQVVGAKKNGAWSPVRPKGMVPIKSGSFVMGMSDKDFAYQGNAPIKTVTISGFFIDDSEVTNEEYTDFVNFVKDSIARRKLAEKAEEMGYTPQKDAAGISGVTSGDGIEQYKFVLLNEDYEGTAYEEWILQQESRESGRTIRDRYRLNWDVDLTWDRAEYPDVDYADVMEGMYYTPTQTFNNERAINKSKLVYRYQWIDQVAAAKAKGRGYRSDFIIPEEEPIYPDTTVWVRDFAYSYNDPMHEYYFWHEAFLDYPVVGVTWKQAMAFCNYRTFKHNKYVQSKGKKGQGTKIIDYRLPSESEWEYAARGGLQDAPYPWGGPYLIDSRGCYLANFKPKRGDYIEVNDKKRNGYMYTAPVRTFPPNGYGLYDMAGNVAEWTQSGYNNSFYTHASTLNPSIPRSQSDRYSFKTVRGGSWKDIGYLLMVGSRDWEHQDTARSFIGFRCVQTIPEGAKVTYRY